MADILKRNSQVIGFGVTHLDTNTNSPTTPTEYFSSIIPLLISRGYCNGVIEGLLDDDSVNDECRKIFDVKEIIGDTKNFPRLNDSYQSAKDKKGFLSFIQACTAQTGLKLYGTFTEDVMKKFNRFAVSASPTRTRSVIIFGCPMPRNTLRTGVREKTITASKKRLQTGGRAKKQLRPSK